MTIGKKYELKLLTSGNEPSPLVVSGEGTFRFDSRKGTILSSRFTGKLEFETEKEMRIVPLKYNYRPVDPGRYPTARRRRRGGGATGVRAEAPKRPAEPPADRLPIPDKEARDAAAALVEEAFGDQCKAARSLDNKLAMVDKLIKAADGEKDPAQRFALLNRARLLAAGAGDLGEARRAADEMVNSFRIDGEKADVAVLRAVAKTATGEQNQPVAEFGANLMEDAILADKFDLAEQLQAIALRAARKCGDTALVKRLQRRGKDLQRICEDFAATANAQAALEKDRDDAAASLTVGKFYCFSKGDWEKGLPLLARGADAALKSVAEKEQANPNTADERLALADQWWQLADDQKGGVKEAMQLRAQKWYREAVSYLSGLGRARAEKRLEQLAKLFPEEPLPEEHEPAKPKPRKSAAEAKKPRTPSAAGPSPNPAETRTRIVGGGGRQFEDAAPEGGVLIGFEIGLGKWGPNDVIATFRPIFRNRQGTEVLGRQHGTPTGKTIRVKAKRGYAVAGLKTKAVAMVDGLSVIFMRQGAHGLNVNSSYESPWVGGTGGMETTLGGDGALVIGIVGRETDKDCPALGLMLKR